MTNKYWEIKGPNIGFYVQNKTRLNFTIVKQKDSVCTYDNIYD